MTAIVQRADRTGLVTKLRAEETKEAERDVAREKEVRRLKGLTDNSQRMVRKLKQQMAGQAALIQKKQTELDAARRGAASIAAAPGSGRPATSPAQPADLRVSVRSLKKSLLRELDGAATREQATHEAAAAAAKLAALRADRARQAGELKGLELRASRPRSAATQAAVGREEAEATRELREAVEDLDAEISYVAQHATGLAKRAAKAESASPVAVERLGPAEARGLVGELLTTIKAERASLIDAERSRAEAEAAADASQAATERVSGEAALAAIEAGRRLEEQRREAEYKLLAAYQKLDRRAADKDPGAAGTGKWKDDQIAILTEHNTIYKKRVKELTRRLREAASLARTQPDTGQQAPREVIGIGISTAVQQPRRSPPPRPPSPISVGGGAFTGGPRTPVAGPPSSRSGRRSAAGGGGDGGDGSEIAGSLRPGGGRQRSPVGGRAIDVAVAAATPEQHPRTPGVLGGQGPGECDQSQLQLDELPIEVGHSSLNAAFRWRRVGCRARRLSVAFHVVQQCGVCHSLSTSDEMWRDLLSFLRHHPAGCPPRACFPVAC